VGHAVPLEEYQSKAQLFFSPSATPTQAEGPEATTDYVPSGSGVPLHWKPIYAITDQPEDVVVVTFDINKPADF
jgi:hypothetical protein